MGHYATTFFDTIAPENILNCFYALLDLFDTIQNTQHIFKICSYIQKLTPNPINALRITIYNTKHTNNTKIHFQQSQHFRNKSKHSKLYKHLIYYYIIYQVSITHILYILYIMYILYILYILATG